MQVWYPSSNLQIPCKARNSVSMLRWDNPWSLWLKPSGRETEYLNISSDLHKCTMACTYLHIKAHSCACAHTHNLKKKKSKVVLFLSLSGGFGDHTYGLICPTTMTLAPNVKTYKPLVLFKKYNCVKPYVYNYISYFSSCCDLISNYSNLRKERFLLAHSWEYMAL